MSRLTLQLQEPATHTKLQCLNSKMPKIGSLTIILPQVMNVYVLLSTTLYEHLNQQKELNEGKKVQEINQE